MFLKRVKDTIVSPNTNTFGKESCHIPSKIKNAVSTCINGYFLNVFDYGSF